MNGQTPDDFEATDVQVRNEITGDTAGNAVQAHTIGSVTFNTATVTGDFVNTGLHLGDVNLLTGAPVRTHYRHQVQRIAPQRLLGRDTELAELAEFCTSAQYAGAYRWWRAPAWSGKTALMSWFVLHAPQAVRIVSFFITARLAAQNDRAAFCDNMIEQLLAFLGRPMPPLTDATRDAHLLALLHDAANACHDRHENFVLVVDGLDEDCGATTGLDTHSIAALLPVELPAGMRVIVTGRPNPPVPEDVPHHHPLRDPSTVRPLGKSHYAEIRQHEMDQDLSRLMDGSSDDQDLVGLLIAAGGGLTASDLAELMGWTRRALTAKLDTIAGRALDRRPARWIGPDGYLLGHEELHQAADAELGAGRVADYRQRIRTWASRYRASDWPPETPEYLLSGYVNMLTAAGDTSEMMTCLTDSARHDRMLDRSGTDAAALAEIHTGLRRLAAQAEPDLASIGRIAVHRDFLAGRTSRMPPELLTAWALLGQLDRAEVLARAITEPEKQARVLADLVSALATAGQHEQALALTLTIADSDMHARSLAAVIRRLAADEDRDMFAALAADAEALARSIAKPDDISPWYLTGLIRALTATGHYQEAETVAYAFAVPSAQTLALIELVSNLIDAGDQEWAHRIAADAEAQVHAIDAPDTQVSAMVWLARALSTDGRRVSTLALFANAETVARSIRDPNGQAQTLAEMAHALAETGELTRAHTLAQAIAVPYYRGSALIHIIEALAASDEFDHAESVARTIIDPYQQASAFAHLAKTLAATGHRDRADILVTDAVALSRASTDYYDRPRALAQFVRTLAEFGDYDRAEALARTIDEADIEASALVTIVDMMAQAGDSNRAHTAACAIVSPHYRSEALSQVVKALAGGGELDRAETVARAIDDPYQQASALANLAETLAAHGHRDRATTLANDAASLAASAIDPRTHGPTLAELVTALTIAGDHARAEAMAADAATLVRTISDPESQQGAVPTVVEALLTIGDFDGAETLAYTVIRPYHRMSALANVVEALMKRGRRDRVELLVDQAASQFEASAGGKQVMVLVKAGHLDQAEALAHNITDPDVQGRALKEVVEAHAEAGDYGRAETAAREINDSWQQSWALAHLATTLALAGYQDRADALVADAEELSHNITDPGDRAWAQAEIVAALAAVGQHDRAESMIHTIAQPVAHARALVAVIETLATSNDHARIGALADRAQFHTRGLASEEIVKALAAAGHYDRAEDLARAITDTDRQTLNGGSSWPGTQARALAHLIVALGKAGYHIRAEGLARTINKPEIRARALAELAELISAIECDESSNGKPAATGTRIASPNLLLAHAFLLGQWSIPLRALANMHPATLGAIADEVRTAFRTM